MPKIAVDIALIPPDAALDQAITVNQSLKCANQAIFLNKETCLPHITLAMGVMDSEKITELAIRLVGLADQFPPVEIIQNGVKTNEVAAGVHFQKTPNLQGLHEAVMNIVEQYFEYEAAADMFLTPPPVDLFPVTFIKEFGLTKAHEGYDSHLTFGLGTFTQTPPDFNFTAARLAVCHLGTYCTCRKILFETTLAG